MSKDACLPGMKERREMKEPVKVILLVALVVAYFVVDKQFGERIFQHKVDELARSMRHKMNLEESTDKRVK